MLFLDDLHWADASTCDILGYLSDRIPGLALLVLATYRPGEIRVEGRRFPVLRNELERKSVSHEVSLGLLRPEDVSSYLDGCFPKHQLPAQFAAVVHERTQGHPLFMSELCRFLKETGIVIERDGQWTSTRSLDDVRGMIPTGALNMIRLTFGRLAEGDRRILQCAAVQGWHFDSAVVGRVLGLDATHVEERLQELHTVHRFVDLIGEHDLPDHTVSVRYQFAHVFYQNALAASVLPSRRAALSLEIARALVATAGETTSSLATTLALLFEAGRDYPEAARFFSAAARNAARIFAYPEVVVLAERGLAATIAIPESRQRDEQELLLTLTLGVGYMVTKGYASPEAARTHARSRELCYRTGETRRLSPVLWGIHTCEVNGGRLRAALDVAEEMVRLADATQSPTARVEALHAVGTTLAFMGRLVDSREHLERILEVSPIEKPVFRSGAYVLDPAVTSLSMLARVLALMGLFPEATKRARQSVEVAARSAHPHSAAYAALWMGAVDYYRGAPGAALDDLERAMHLSQEHGFPQVLEWARFLHGSALAQTGAGERGIAGMRESLENQGAMHCLLERSFCLTVLAEALVDRGAAVEALALCDSALEIAAATDARCYEADTRRVRALARGALGAKARQVGDELRAALSLARSVEAKALELRAAVALVEFVKGRDRAAALKNLIDLVNWFSLDDDSPCVQRARVLCSVGA